MDSSRLQAARNWPKILMPPLAGTVSPQPMPAAFSAIIMRTLLLVPAGYQLPAEDQPVKIQIELAEGRERRWQRLLAEQTRVLLATQGFHEAVGYDNHGHTRLLGTIPAAALPRLLDDLRVQTGWLAPSPAVQQLPDPIRTSWPVRIVEVIPEPAGAPPLKAQAAESPVPPGQAQPFPECALTRQRRPGAWK